MQRKSSISFLLLRTVSVSLPAAQAAAQPRKNRLIFPENAVILKVGYFRQIRNKVLHIQDKKTEEVLL